MFKKTLIIFVLFFALTNTAFASSEIDFLKEKGLIRGYGNSLHLEDTLTREQGAVMLVRLLGKEDFVQNNTFAHPFDDVPSWADNYVGYLYQNNLIRGMSETYFGAGRNLSEKDYVTMMLRVLGYSDVKKEFSWSNSVYFARTVGLKHYPQKSNVFLREDMAMYTYIALNLKMKGENSTLGTSLGIVTPSGTKVAIQNSGEEELMQLQYRNLVLSKNDLINNIIKMIYEMDNEKTFSLSAYTDYDYLKVIDEAINIAEASQFCNTPVHDYKVSYGSDEATITFRYRTTKQKLDSAKNEAKKVVSTITNSSMSDYEKELAIHDYLVDSIRYDSSSNAAKDSYTIYGALIGKKAVCQGYAEAFNYMLGIAGIKSNLISGEVTLSSNTLGKHVWNQVTIDGELYHVDVTWDDPISSDGKNIKIYNYFNITDEEMKKNHFWDTTAYRACNATKHNYYNYNGKTAYSIEDFKSKVENAIENKVPSYSIKYTGGNLSKNDVKNILGNMKINHKIIYRFDDKNDILDIESVS